MTGNLTDKNLLESAFAIVSEEPDTEVVVSKLRDLLNVDHVVYVLLKPDAAPYVRLTYPAAWVLRYLQQGYTTIDPISREGGQRILPFDWSEISIKDTKQASFLQDARSHGIGPHGYSIPLDERGYKGLFSISFSRSEHEWTHFLQTAENTLVHVAARLHRRVVGEVFGEGAGVEARRSR
jgi:LuxR family transcriptional regulator, quorum-sensing system regulator CinR